MWTTRRTSSRPSRNFSPTCWYRQGRWGHFRAGKAGRDSRESRALRVRKGTRALRAIRVLKDHKVGRARSLPIKVLKDPRVGRAGRDSRGFKALRVRKEIRGLKGSRDLKAGKVGRGSREFKDLRVRKGIKGPHFAVEIARKLKFGLDLVGDDTITTEPEYRDKLKAESVNGISYVGPQTREQCVGWFSANKALLHMNLRFREPFGLAPVEAQACGMPVIAFRNGAMGETVRHGETGFLAYSKEEIEELIRSDAVSSIKPENCREWALQFTAERMINRYEELAKEAVEKPW